MKTSVIVSDTTFSDKNEAIFIELNRVVKTLEEVSLCYLNLSNNIITPDFAIMNATELYNFWGSVLISTCVETSRVLTKASVNAKKVFFMWDLFFLHDAFDFVDLRSTLEKLTLIVRSEDHAKIIKNLFNLDCHVAPFELEKIWNLLE
jgi:hypothetical protein